MNKKKLQILINAKDQTAGAFKKVGKNIAMVGAAMAAFSAAVRVKAVSSAANFSKAMSNVSTLVDTNIESMEDMKKKILDVSKRTPVALDDLTAALYAVRSAGISAGDAMDVLEESARLGVAGLGTTEEATTLMVLALNNFRESGLSAAEISDILFKTVKGGITNIADLSQSFGLVAPLAVEAGVSFEELQAMTAALTQVNKSASISQNEIKASLVSLGKPTEAAIELFRRLGVETFSDLIKKTGSYMNAVEALKEATEGNTMMWNSAIGSGEALTAVNALLGAQSEAVAEYMWDMTEGSNAVKEAFEKQNKEATAQYQLFKNNLNVVLVKLGAEILPVLNKMMEKIISVIALVTEKFDKLGGGSGILKIVITFVKELKEKFTQLLEYIDLKTGAVTFLKTTWDDLVAVFKYSLLPVLEKLWEAFKPVLPFLKLWAIQTAKITGLLTVGLIVALKYLVVITVEIVKLFVGSLTAAIKSITGLWEGLVGVLGSVIKAFKDVWSWAKKAAGSVSSGWKNLGANLGFGGARAMGGAVSQGKSYLVGERGPELFTPISSGTIIPNNKLKSSGGNIVINVYGDVSGEELIDKVKNSLWNSLQMNGQVAT